MPIRSGAMQRPRGSRCGNTLRQRYDEVGLPCSSTTGSPSPISTYAISLPRTRRRCFWYGNAAEIELYSNSLTGLLIDEVLVFMWAYSLKLNEVNGTMRLISNLRRFRGPSTRSACSRTRCSRQSTIALIRGRPVPALRRLRHGPTLCSCLQGEQLRLLTGARVRSWDFLPDKAIASDVPKEEQLNRTEISKLKCCARGR